MKYMPAMARILMGLAFTVFGLNGFIHFMPEPKDMPPAEMDFLRALIKSGFMMPLVSGTQLLVGILLLVNCFVPLALALIAPIIVGIIGFHLFLAPSSIGPGIVVLVLELFLAWSYHGAFRPMLRIRVKPGP